MEIYTAKAVDLTGTITASDDVLDNTDFYEGAFQSYFIGVNTILIIAVLGHMILIHQLILSLTMGI